jgi:hypothetical protein
MVKVSDVAAFVGYIGGFLGGSGGASITGHHFEPNRPGGHHKKKVANSATETLHLSIYHPLCSADHSKTWRARILKGPFGALDGGTAVRVMTADGIRIAVLVEYGVYVSTKIVNEEFPKHMKVGLLNCGCDYGFG